MKQAHGGCQRAESTDSTWLAQDADPLPRAGQSSASAGKKRRGRPEGTRPRRVPRRWLSFRVSGLSLGVLVTAASLK